VIWKPLIRKRRVLIPGEIENRCKKDEATWRYGRVCGEKHELKPYEEIAVWQIVNGKHHEILQKNCQTEVDLHQKSHEIRAPISKECGKNGRHGRNESIYL